jgi:hypothetical protein
MADSAFDFAVEVVRDRASLARFIPQWQDLAAHALERNPLYEHSMLLPALEALGEGDFHCCLLWVRDPERSDLPAKLGGLFPFRRERRYHGFPATALRSWGRPSWMLCTPLVRAEGAQRHVAALLDWVDRDGAALVEFRHVPSDGPFNGALADALLQRKSTVLAIPVVEGWGKDSRSMHNVVIGSGAWGEMWVSMLPFANWAKRRIASTSRRDAVRA